MPAVIGQAGTWCLDRNLQTSDIGVIAIDIQVDNITLDCNTFRLSGANGARGINAANRRHIAVRN